MIRPRLRAWFRALFRGAAIDRDVEEEMRLHIDLEAEALAESSQMPAAEARRRALVAFGGVERYKEAHRDARGIRWLHELGQDLRYGARSLARTPVFSVSALLVLALGIGASTTVFGAVHAVLLTRLPYPRDEQLVEIGLGNTLNVWHLSMVDYQALVSEQHSFSALGTESYQEVALQVPGAEPTRELAVGVTSGVFQALGVAAARGRVIEPADERPGAPPVAVVSARFAKRAFGGDAQAVGRIMTMDGRGFTIVGVLPPEVRTLGRASSDLWPALEIKSPSRRGPFFFIGVARLKDGVTLESARRDLDGVSVRLFPIWAASFQDRTARLTPLSLRQRVLGDAARTLGVFAGAVALVLLVAVANVASLSLVRTSGRRRELGVRTMLGGTRTRLARMLVTESVLLAGVGSVIGLGLAALGLRVLVAIGPHVPRLADAGPDATMLLFASMLALLVGVVIGAAPVALLLRGERTTERADGSRLVGTGRRAQTIRAGFVVAQFALTLPLLAGAGLLLNSFIRLAHVEPGFDPRHVMVVHVSLPGARYANDTVIAAYWSRALPRVRDVAGVVSAGLGEYVPPREDNIDLNNFDVIDRPVPQGAVQPVAPWITATSEYFSTLGIPLVEGRLFTLSDNVSAPTVIVVSREWVRRYSPDAPAVGRKLMTGGCTTCPPVTIVGIVGDVKVQGLNQPGEAMYAPPSQGWPQQLNVFVRTAGPPVEAMRRVLAALRSVDAGVPLDSAGPLDQRISASVVQPRHWTILLGGFAVAALILAAVGIFGLLSYTVSERRREIGVRIALGAHHRTVVTMFVRNAMVYAVLGAAIGLVVAFYGTRTLAGSLFDVSATDPPTMAAVTLVLLVAALAAAYLPARRAATVDPVTALRLD